MNTSNQELLEYRIGLFHDAVEMKKNPDRVPHLSNFWAWMILDAGYGLSEAIFDYSKMEDVVIRFQGKYGFDYLSYIGQRLNRVRNVFGASPHHVNDENECVTYDDIPLIESSELEELSTNFIKCLWEKALPRKYEKFKKDMPIELFKQAGLELIAYRKFCEKLAQRLKNEYAVPSAATESATMFFISPSIESLFNIYRGIKGLSADLRRSPDRLEEAIKAMDEANMIPVIKAIEQSPKGRNKDLVFDCNIMLLSHTILNPKQIDRFLWPSVKKVLDAIVAADKSIYVFAEGFSEPLWNYLAEYPKGHIALHVEQDDIFKARKRLPNCCLVGGMTDALLGLGTEQQCIDYAKRLVDEVGADGGFIMSQNKMMTSRIDCKAESLNAVCNFIRNYHY